MFLRDSEVRPLGWIKTKFSEKKLLWKLLRKKQAIAEFHDVFADCFAMEAAAGTAIGRVAGGASDFAGA